MHWNGCARYRKKCSGLSIKVILLCVFLNLLNQFFFETKQFLCVHECKEGQSDCNVLAFNSKGGNDMIWSGPTANARGCVILDFWNNFSNFGTVRWTNKNCHKWTSCQKSLVLKSVEIFDPRCSLHHVFICIFNHVIPDVLSLL